MAISFADATGNLFNRLGKIIKGIRHVNGNRGVTAPVGSVSDPGAKWGTVGPTVADSKTIYDGIYTQYTGSQADLVSGSFALYSKRDAARQAQSTQINDLKTLANNTLI